MVNSIHGGADAVVKLVETQIYAARAQADAHIRALSRQLREYQNGLNLYSAQKKNDDEQIAFLKARAENAERERDSLRAQLLNQRSYTPTFTDFNLVHHGPHSLSFAGPWLELWNELQADNAVPITFTSQLSPAALVGLLEAAIMKVRTDKEAAQSLGLLMAVQQPVLEKNPSHSLPSPATEPKHPITPETPTVHLYSSPDQPMADACAPGVYILNATESHTDLSQSYPHRRPQAPQ